MYVKISFSTVKQLPVTQIEGEKQEKASKNLCYFVYKSSSLPRSIQTLCNNQDRDPTSLSSQAIDFRAQSCVREENLKNTQKNDIFFIFEMSDENVCKLNFPLQKTELNDIQSKMELIVTLYCKQNKPKNWSKQMHQKYSVILCNTL